MAPIRYSLHYEDYSEHLMSRFGKLLQIQSLVDMTLMCSSHTLRVHKAVLAASSAYFQEVLQKQTGEPLIILKMRFSVLKSLVEFMYCGKTQCLEENLDELVAAAQFLKIKGLSKVTKEGLGIANNGELPVFTPPVVINRPPQSLIDLHTQDNGDPKPQSQMVPTSTSGQPMDGLNRPNKDMVVRIPFDIDNGGGATGGMDYTDTPRVIKPRRGRPSARRGWEGNVALGRAAERALLRREQDSRKAIHQLKHLQTRQMQDYMDRVTLSQAVNSICGPEPVPAHNYMNMDNDLMYMDRTVSSNVLDTSMSYSKDHSLGTETSSIYSNAPSSGNETVTSGIGTAMSQYVNALKSAGLPTDLPILFESGDGSYINVNEQVLLDMVQSSEIQYEVIEQPNIIEKVSDPTEIKSIDDLSKSIERGEMLMGPKSYANAGSYGKDSNHYNRHEDSMNSLNSILPDNLESFGDQQNYVVLDPQLQESNNALNHDNSNDFSCIDGDMKFFTKFMGDDVKKYYEDNQLNDSRTMEHFGPASTALDTSFSMSLLDSKISHLNDNMSHQFNSLNHDDLRKNDDCYDFGLQLPHGSDFKVDALDCLMSTPKRTDDNDNDNAVQEREEIIKDLMNIENKMNMACNGDKPEKRNDISIQDFIVDPFNDRVELDPEPTNHVKETEQVQHTDEIPDNITSSGLQWDSLVSDKNKETSIQKENESPNHDNNMDISESETQLDYQAIIDLTNSKEKNCQSIARNETDKENQQPNKDPDMSMPLDEDVPFAVGLLPLKQAQQPVEDCCDSLKRKSPNFLEDSDARCLKRKAKFRKL